MPWIIINVVNGARTKAVCGLNCICDGRLYASSFGDGPGAFLNDAPVYISRVIEDDPKRPYPILVGNKWTNQLGWVSARSLWAQNPDSYYC